MPFQTVTLMNGVRLEQTPTLLKAAVVKSNLIRWRGGLPEKLGGWQSFYQFPITGVPRQLWPWEDTSGQTHIAVATVGTGGNVTVINENGSINNVTPQYIDSSIAPNFSTTAGSIIVSVNDPTLVTSIYDSVEIQNHVAIGGIVIFGSYPIISSLSSSSYTIDIDPGSLGIVPGNTVLNGGTLATYTTTSGSQFVNVNLPANGYSVGQIYSIPVQTSVNGVTLQGFYEILSVTPPDNFLIAAQNKATASGSAIDNGAKVNLRYWVTGSQTFAGGGYGGGPYGMGSWGMSVGGGGSTGTGTQLTAPDWTLANFADGSLILSPLNGPIFSWDPASGLTGSTALGNGPQHCAGFFIAMPQEQIVAYGSASAYGNTQLVQDPMLVSWCDNATKNAWFPSVANQAGSYRLTRGSKIVGGIQGPQQAMLWTDVGVWLMQYIGYPNVWGFFEVAQGCGLIAKNAVGVVGGKVFWMGVDGFWMFAAGMTQRLPCEVWDLVFPASLHLNQNFLANIRAAANSSYDEIAWHFPSAASTSGENDTYVKFNTVSGEWDYGSLAIKAWVDNNIFGTPLSLQSDATGQNTLILQHETSPDANGQPINYSYTTGYFMLSDGEDKVFVDQMIPDFKWSRMGSPPTTSAQVSLTLYSQEYPDSPNQPPVTYGPYAVTNATNAIEVRVRGRYFSATISGNDLGSFSRLGGIKFRFAPDGRT